MLPETPTRNQNATLPQGQQPRMRPRSSLMKLLLASLLGLSMAGPSSAAAGEEETPVELGSRRELFLDDLLIGDEITLAEDGEVGQREVDHARERDQVPRNEFFLLDKEGTVNEVE